MLTFSILICLGQSSSFLSYPTENGKILFKEVVQSNESQATLFKNAHKFLLSQDFYGPCKVISKNGRQLNQPIVHRKTDIVDSLSGKIGGKAYYIVNYGTDNFFTLNFDYEIKVKDKLYKYELTNFHIYEYRSIPKYATQTGDLGYTLDKIVQDGNVDVYTLEEFRQKIQFPSTTNQTVMSNIEIFVKSIKETMSGAAPVKWE
jgi:hypothetical protein